MLFDKILQSGYYPANLTEGIIVPIHKSGDINDSENYRRIILLSIFGTLFTRILNNRLTLVYTLKPKVVLERTIAHIFSLHNINDLIFSKNVRSKLYCTFVDFRKAFDYIKRDNLWYKLLTQGIRGKLLLFFISSKMKITIKNMYQNNQDNNKQIIQKRDDNTKKSRKSQGKYI